VRDILGDWCVVVFRRRNSPPTGESSASHTAPRCNELGFVTVAKIAYISAYLANYVVPRCSVDRVCMGSCLSAEYAHQSPSRGQLPPTD
jgi:hypothetical protein